MSDMSQTTRVTAMLSLPAVLDIQAVMPLAQALIGKRGADLQLNGSEVQRLGAQCLQVLLSAQSSWVSDAHTLTIISPSHEFCSALTLLGVNPGLAPLESKDFS